MLPVQWESFGLRGWQGSIGVMERPHRHVDLEFNFLLEGGVDYWVAGQSIHLPAQQLAVFWAAIPHQVVQTQSPAHLIWITLPLEQFLRWPLPAGLNEALFAGQLLQSPLELSTVLRWLEDLSKPLRQRAMLLEMEAWFNRLPLAQQAPPASQPSSEPVLRMAAFISQNYQEPIRVRNMAQAVGLHPNYASTVFSQQMGQTLSSYLSAYRIAHAQRLLATTEMGVLEIALDSGFASASRFYVAFTRATQTTPLQFRRKMRGG